MKRLLAFMLVVAMILTTTGCGSDNKEQDKGLKKPEQTKEQSKELSKEQLMDLFPETLEMKENKLLKMKESFTEDEESVTLYFNIGSDRENSYLSFEMEDCLKLEVLEMEKDSYARLDSRDVYTKHLSEEELEELKRDYAESEGMDVADLSDEEFEAAIMEEAVLYGYNEAEDSAEDTETENDPLGMQESIVDQEEIDKIYSAFKKDQLSYVDDTEDEVIASYKVEGYDVPVEIRVNKETKEISFLKFETEETSETTGASQKVEVEMNIEDFDINKIDTSWITKDADMSVADVSMTASMMMIGVLIKEQGGIELDDSIQDSEN